jgi:hypothetical protein
MTRNTKDWRRALLMEHLELFQPAADPRSAEGWPCVGDGWRDPLERLCLRVRAAVEQDGGTFKFSQVKEKYGTLRTYWSGKLSREASDLVEAAIELAEARSACTCEICGEAGRLYGGNWFTTRCRVHAEGRPVVETDRELDDVHVVRRTSGGKIDITYKRYDRDSDVFIDVDPASVGIEEE